RVVEEVAAGAMPRKAVGPGQCTRIFTGAPIPDGADAVVMQEAAEASGDRVRIADAAVRAGQYGFPRGPEMRGGAVGVTAGTRTLCCWPAGYRRESSTGCRACSRNSASCRTSIGCG